MSGSLVVKNQPLGHYVLSVFSLLFRDQLPHNNKICISAPGRTIGRTADLANLLTDNFARNLLQIDDVKIGKIDDSETAKVSTIEISLSEKHYSQEGSVEGSFKNFMTRVSEAIETPRVFSVCELEFILSTLLKDGFEFSLSCPVWKDIEIQNKLYEGDQIDLGKIELNSNNDIIYKLISDNGKGVTARNNPALVSQGFEPALMRMGILQSPEYEALAKDICQHDDVILAVDTNMFYKCQVTSALLNSFVGVTRTNYLDTPNWITVVASTVSIAELEHNANLKPSMEKDKMCFRRRREACRGLQEFIEIGSCIDLEGVSILLTGDIPSELNFSTEGSATIRDEIIRLHLKEFFKDIDFHKGTYFLTQDKICEMFAKAEGLNAFYLPRQNLDLDNPIYNLTNLSKSRDINNISELIYELGIQYPISIKCTDQDGDSINLEVETDWADKSLEDWEDRCVRLSLGVNKSGIEKKILECKKERDKFEKKAQKAKENGNQQFENLSKQYQKYEDELKNLTDLSNQEKEANQIINKLEDNGKRIGLNDLLKGWRKVNAERHVL